MNCTRCDGYASHAHPTTDEELCHDCWLELIHNPDEDFLRWATRQQVRVYVGDPDIYGGPWFLGDQGHLIDDIELSDH